MAARKRKLSFSDSARAVLTAETPDGEVRDALNALGLEPTVLNAILWGMSGKAAKGDPPAAKFLRETLEEEKGRTPAPGEPDLSTLADGELRALISQIKEREGT